MTTETLSVNPMDKLPPPIRRWADLGSQPGDDEDTVFKKRLLVLTASFVVLVGLAVLALSFSVGPGPDPLPVVYIVVTVVGFVLIARTKHLEPFRTSQLIMYATFPVFEQWLLGGWINSGAAMMFSITAPLLAIVFVGAGAWRLWLSVYVAAAIVSGLLDSLIRDRVEPVPMSEVVFLFAITAIGVGAAAVLPLAFFVQGRKRLLEEVARERYRADALLHDVLPDSIADRLKEGERPIADRFETVGVLFADIVGSTSQIEAMEPGGLIDDLNHLFTTFDRLAAIRDLEKVRTIGDAYMVISGAPEAHSDVADRIAEMALAMREAAGGMTLGGRPIELRFGIDVGPVVAGVIGETKFHYDVYGDTVNTASRMESEGEPGRIQVTERVQQMLSDRFLLAPRGRVKVRGKGAMRTFFLEGVSARPV